ncbi:MAG: radical SAM protein [Candidatus Falkowbacteria bacterium]
MIINTIQCKTVLTKSKLPEVAYCINPYVGCLHACAYCYARFMRRFTGHLEPWGCFLDVKLNAPEILAKELAKEPKRGAVLLGSVTDAYQPIEQKYRLTRAILEILLQHDFPVSILTKSDLVVRDIDLFKQFNECEVGLTLTTTDAEIAKDLEPGAAIPQKRIAALETLHKNGISTYAFIGPILPGLTDLDAVFGSIRDKVNFVMAESLNTKCGNWQNIQAVLSKRYPHLLPLYQVGLDKAYWDSIENQVKALSKRFNIPLKGFYRH